LDEAETRTEPQGLTVERDRIGLTLAALVREVLPGTSWSRARDLCRDGRVLVDGAAQTDAAYRPAAGTRVELRLAGPSLPRGPLPPSAVVHLDADIVVVDKPAGLLTVPFDRDDRDTLLALTRVAIRRLESGRGRSPGQAAGPPNPTLRAVQRLDKETSGLVVFARNVQAQRQLQEQFSRHDVLRRYLAIVHGEARDATYDTLLVPNRGDGLRGSWRGRRSGRGEPPPDAKQAITRVRVEERLAGATLVSCELETGRQHQIRIHLAEAGHPLVGETVYIRDWRGPRLPAPRPMLHATALGFKRPRDGRSVRFEAPPPADFTAVLQLLR
jgi:23S rRNA pseudouridine1911/1915/1917 synthase